MCVYIGVSSLGRCTWPSWTAESGECSPPPLFHTEPTQPHTHAKSGRSGYKSHDVRSRSGWTTDFHSVPAPLSPGPTDPTKRLPFPLVIPFTGGFGTESAQSFYDCAFFVSTVN